ncbi:alpha/beta fold hydrolase [Streptomyces sp. NBC_00105]|uniref:alpha/beta fold hydrolase n=1 Tax=Streptomyces sp. NBC_00105 TaxID=2903622 RepID=UPI0032489809
MTPERRPVVHEGHFVHRGARLVFDDAGEGPLAVYAHGGFVSQAVEDRVGLFDWAPVLRAGRRLVRYDARAHGRSTGGPSPSEYTYPSLADDLLALLDHLGAGRGRRCHGGLDGMRQRAARGGPGARQVLPAGHVHPSDPWTTREAYAWANRSAAETVTREGPGAWLAGSPQEPHTGRRG